MKSDRPLLLGIDVGGTKSAALLGDDSGTVLDRIEIPTGPPDDTLDQLFSDALRLSRGQEISACGISCGGPLSRTDGVILSPPNLPGWDRVPIVAIAQQRLGIPAHLENDANAAALAEWRWGVSRSIDNLIYLTCGTGQGAGLILDGKLYRGKQDLAGEIGHVRLRPDGPVGYGKSGSVEGFTSAKALTAFAAAIPSLSRFTPAQIGQAALHGDADAQRIVVELGRHLGEACAILIDLLNPQRISLGSLSLRLGSLLLDPLVQAARAQSLPMAFEACTIAPASLGQRIQDCAALAVAAAVDPRGL